MHDDVARLIAHFSLTPLPSEGTLFASTWRSDSDLPTGGPHGTAMIGLYCSEPLSHSLFHRLPVDEVWHFHAGDPLTLILLYPDGSSRDVVMGPDPLRGDLVQFVVPAGVWQAGHVCEGGTFALFGCTMAPGFTSVMYEGGERNRLLAHYPGRREDITRFGCDVEIRLMPDGFAT